MAVGEPLDFWRVVDVEPDRSLELKAEMLVPGEAWLGWKVDPRPGGGSTLVQTAWFVPRGLFGRLYWWSVVPFHVAIFPVMLRRLAAATAPIDVEAGVGV